MGRRREGELEPREIARLLAAADVVVGSRYVPGDHIENWPLSRPLLSREANLLMRLMAGPHVHDWTSGFKCYKSAVLKSLPFGPGGIRSEGYSFQIDILFHCQREGWRIREVPITFVNRRHGRTKVSRAEVDCAILTLLRIACRRLWP